MSATQRALAWCHLVFGAAALTGSIAFVAWTRTTQALLPAVSVGLSGSMRLILEVAALGWGISVAILCVLTGVGLLRESVRAWVRPVGIAAACLAAWAAPFGTAVAALTLWFFLAPRHDTVERRVQRTVADTFG